MTMQMNGERDQKPTAPRESAAPSDNWLAAAALSVLIVATITLTIVASGFNLSASLPPFG